MSQISGRSASSRSSAKSRRARLVALQQEQLFRQREEQLENLTLVNQQERKRLELEKAMAVTRAELEVFQQDSDDDMELTNLSLHATDADDRSIQNSGVQPPRPVPQVLISTTQLLQEWHQERPPDLVIQQPQPSSHVQSVEQWSHRLTEAVKLS